MLLPFFIRYRTCGFLKKFFYLLPGVWVKRITAADLVKLSHIDG